MQRRNILAGIASLALLGACGKAAKLSAIAPGQVVLAFGDSVTFGTGAAPGEDWPSQLAEQTGWQVINAGIPGDTAQAGKARIQALLDEHHPALVIVEIGGNDFLRRRPPNDVKGDIRTLLKSIKQSGAQVVLVAIPELSLMSIVAGKPSDSPIFKELGKEEGVLIVSDVFSDVLSNPELCADKVHPNAKGYRQMAGGLVARFREIGLIR
ncbi:MAG TPA: GDSL-type esterase/lipase family protein [Rhodoferax sp.]|nr:GDSL-type esterase/lipase family protein [Rhodoferax sp.]